MIAFLVNSLGRKYEKTLSDRKRLQRQYGAASELPVTTIQCIRCFCGTTDTFRKN